MRTKNRRKHVFIDKALQGRYLLYMVMTITAISGVSMTGTYFGIWASVVKTFSEESLRHSILTAARINEYNQARRASESDYSLPSIRFFKETSLLSERQREMLHEIMDETNQRIVGLGILLLIFIAWGSIFLTHKIAGPLFKLNRYFLELEKRNLTVRIGFRKFDEMHYLADRFNEMSASLDAAISKMKRVLREVPETSAMQELKKELAQFKTSSD